MANLRLLGEKDWKDKIYVKLTGIDDIKILKFFIIKNNLSINPNTSLFSKTDNGIGFLYLEIDANSSKELDEIDWKYTGNEGIASDNFSKTVITLTDFINEIDRNYKNNLHPKTISNMLNDIKNINDAPQMIKDLNKIMFDTFGMDISITLNIPK